MGPGQVGATHWMPRMGALATGPNKLDSWPSTRRPSLRPGQKEQKQQVEACRASSIWRGHAELGMREGTGRSSSVRQSANGISKPRLSSERSWFHQDLENS